MGDHLSTDVRRGATGGATSFGAGLSEFGPAGIVVGGIAGAALGGATGAVKTIGSAIFHGISWK